MLPNSALALLLGLTTLSPAHPGALPGAEPQERDPESLLARVDLIAAEAMAGSGAGRLVVLADIGGETLFARGYGDARGDAAPMEFRTGALGDLFTAVCLLQLASEDALDLDADLGTQLEGLAWEDETIPIRALLSHTSGLPNDELFLTALATRRAQGAVTEAASEEKSEHDMWVEVLAALELESEPESCFAYEHTNHVVAAMLLEHIAGEPLAECFRSRLFEPLGMSATSFRSDGPALVEDVVTQRIGAREVRVPSHAELFEEELLCSSAGDLARFMRGLVERELLDDSAFRALSTPVRLEDGSETGFGLGMGSAMLEDRAGLVIGGAMAGSRAQVAYYPEFDLTIVALADDAEAPLQRVERRVARAVLDMPEPGVHDWPLTQRELERYVGPYQIGCTTLEVRAAGDHLLLAYEDQPELRLLHQGMHRFVAGPDPELRLSFALEGEQATSFELDDHGRVSLATRFGR